MMNWRQLQIQRIDWWSQRRTLTNQCLYLGEGQTEGPVYFLIKLEIMATIFYLFKVKLLASFALMIIT